ncbi:hypothetical protein AHAS_Ahas02G0102900 [Arachis hypogaea]
MQGSTIKSIQDGSGCIISVLGSGYLAYIWKPAHLTLSELFIKWLHYLLMVGILLLEFIHQVHNHNNLPQLRCKYQLHSSC